MLSEKRKQSLKDYCKRQTAAGLCTSGDGAVPKPGRKKCERCLEISRQHGIKRRAKEPLKSRFDWLVDEAKRKGHAPPAGTFEEFKGWFQSQVALQNSRCGCGTHFGKGEPHVDHDHETGKLRGLLCMKCNMVEGNRDKIPHVVYYSGKHNPELFSDGGGI